MIVRIFDFCNSQPTTNSQKPTTHNPQLSNKNMIMKTIYTLKTTLSLTTILTYGLWLTAFGTLHAQSWQWGKSGGTTDSFNGLDEEVKSACTDIYGNVYFVSDVGSTNSQIDGVPKQNYNNGFGLLDGIVASFSCSGAYRWTKVIGGGVMILSIACRVIHKETSMFWDKLILLVMFLEMNQFILIPMSSCQLLQVLLVKISSRYLLLNTIARVFFSGYGCLSQEILA